MAATIITTRATFEALIDLRLREAKLLIDQLQDWDGAFYLAGYAVEFAFKIRLIAQLQGLDYLPDKTVSSVWYSHNLMELRKATGLDLEMDADPVVGPRWTDIREWSEQSRYQVGKTEQQAKQLYEAITNEVLPWIKARW